MMQQKQHNVENIIDVRINGRGGQGAVTASRLLAEAALEEGKYVHAFPNFGPERAGAPVTAYTRISEGPFSIKTEVTEPDYVVVIDPTLLDSVDVAAGLKPEGTIIVNFPGTLDELKQKLSHVKAKIYRVDGTKIAMEEIDKNVPNLLMLGALAKVTGVVKVETLAMVTKRRFAGEIGEKNEKAIYRAAKEVEGP